MEIREASYLLTIEEEGSITKAANSLFLTQPGLTKSLKKLEEEFDGALFVKDNKRLVPTDLGETVLKYCRRISDDYREMKEAVMERTGKRRETLRFGAPSMCSNIYAPALANFSIEHPELSLVPMEYGGPEMAAELEKGNLDCAIMMCMNDDKNYNTRSVFKCEAAVAVDKKHEWASREYIEIEDLRNVGFVTVDESFYFNRLVMSLFRKRNVEPKPVLLGKEVEWLMQYAKLTNTPCILPSESLEQHSWPSMLIKPLRPTIPFELKIIYPKRGMNSITKEFVKYMLEVFAS